ALTPAARDVGGGPHTLAGVAALPVVGAITGRARGRRAADRRTELVGDRLDIFGEVLPALHGPPAGNDDLCRGELRALRFRQFLAYEGGNAGIGSDSRLLDWRRAAARAGRLEGRGAHRDHLGLVLRAHGLHRVAGID